MKIEDNKVVVIDYTLKDNDGEIIDSSENIVFIVEGGVEPLVERSSTVVIVLRCYSMTQSEIRSF